MSKTSFPNLGVTLLLSALAIGAVGCGDLANDRITTVCDCENCGDRELEEVEIRVQAELDIASAYDCIEVLDPYWECQLQEYECDDGHYRDDEEGCQNEAQQLYECLDAKSTRRGGPYWPY
jgi:hypothetical protein